MSTCSELHVPNLHPAHIAPVPTGANRKCSHLPPAAPSIHSGTKPALPPMPAPPAPGSVSCHEKHATVTVLRTLCTKTPLFAHFLSKTDRVLTATASRYESPCQYPVTRSEEKIHKTGLNWSQQRTRYPIDTLPIPDFRTIRSQFASYLDALGPILDRIGPILAHMRGIPDKNTDATTDFDPDFGTRRRCGPRRGVLLAQKAGHSHPRHRRIRCQKPLSAADDSR